jgi:hypothetical protein
VNAVKICLVLDVVISKRFKLLSSICIVARNIRWLICECIVIIWEKQCMIRNY